MVTIMQVYKRNVGGLKQPDWWERNLVMSVHIDKLLVAFVPNSGDPISVGACQQDTTTQTIWQQGVGGEPVQRHQLAHRAFALDVLVASAHVGMENVG